MSNKDYDTPTLVQQLYLCALQSTGAESPFTIVVDSLEDADKDAHMSQADIVWINGSKIQDPIYVFWKLKFNNVLADKAHVMFVPAPVGDRGWEDLAKEYKCVQWGDIALLVYRANRKPQPLPSMKDLRSCC